MIDERHIEPNDVEADQRRKRRAQVKQASRKKWAKEQEKARHGTITAIVSTQNAVDGDLNRGPFYELVEKTYTSTPYEQTKRESDEDDREGHE